MPRLPPSKSLPVDVRCRQLRDQIRACAALDDVHQQAALLVEIAGYLDTGEIEIRATAWDKPAKAPAFEGAAIFARFAGTCALCRGQIRIGAEIIYSPESRQAAHSGCAEAGA